MEKSLRVKELDELLKRTKKARDEFYSKLIRDKDKIPCSKAALCSS